MAPHEYGAMAVTMQELATRLNLSHATVSRVLNRRNDRFISERTRERVWLMATELGYRPNRAAQALVTGRTRQIALWMNGIYTTFHAQVIHAMEEQLCGSGYQIVIGSLPQTVSADWVKPWHVDGYLVFEGDRCLEMLAPKGAPIPPTVSMGGTNAAHDAVDSVLLDLSAGAATMLEHLAEQGAHRIAFVGEAFPESRLVAYKQFVSNRGTTCEIIATKSQHLADVRLAVSSYLALHSHPDALFCFNDDVAIATYKAVRDAGLRVPQDIAISGCDGIEDTEYLDVPITTLKLPLAEMCATAWKRLQERMEDPTQPVHQVRLCPELVVRASSRLGATDVKPR